MSAVDFSAHNTRLCAVVNGVFIRFSKRPVNFQQMCSKYAC